MDIKDYFFESEYQDAPHLSDQLLLPNLALGFDLNIVSAFAPSYIFKLLRDLAESAEIEPGFLNLTFFIPGGLNKKAEGIARFRQYLLRHAQNEVVVAQFIEDALQVIQERKLRISLLFGTQQRPLAKGCIGVISHKPSDSSTANDGETVTADFVTFVDFKGGDYNSPVTPRKSWVEDDFLETQDVFRDVKSLSSGDKGLLLGDNEVVSWLEYLSDWYVQNEPSPNELDLEFTEFFVELPDGDPLLAHLLELGEFQRDDDYSYEAGYYVVDDFNWDRWFARGGMLVEISEDEAVYGHIPPVKGIGAVIIQNAKATCVCGKVFTRAYGCPRVEW